MRVHILSHLGIDFAGTHPLYPIFKWKDNLKKKDISIRVFKNHENKTLYECDVLILIHRYFHHLYKTNDIQDFAFIIELIQKAKKNGAKVIFYDAGDSTGSREFSLLPYVDKFLKKQILKDRNLYLSNNGDKSVRIWINKFDIASSERYVPATKEFKHKINLGWNIGLGDYRYFPTQRYLGLISNRMLSLPKFIPPSKARNIDTSFRGTVNYNNEVALQRNKTLEILKSLKSLKIITGDKVKRSQYLQELRDTKVVISPFGWGELCFRDFEAFMAGNILIKPDITHLETFPNYFKPSRTYLPVKWDMSNLEEILLKSLNQYSEMKEIASNGQKIFRENLIDGSKFTEHFEKIVSFYE